MCIYMESHNTTWTNIRHGTPLLFSAYIYNNSLYPNTICFKGKPYLVQLLLFLFIYVYKIYLGSPTK